MKKRFVLHAGFLILVFLTTSSCSSLFSTRKKEEVSHPSINPLAGVLTTLTAEHVKHYKDLLKDPHSEIQLAAATVLLDHGDHSGEPTLLEALKGEDTHHRLDAFAVLCDHPTQEILPALQQAIEAEKDAMARFVMKRTLKKARQKLQ